MTTKHTPGPWKINGPVMQCPDGKNVPGLVVSRMFTADTLLIAAAPELLEAAKLFLAFYNDLAKSNPGFMGKLCLQDYGQWNRALIALPAAIAKAEKG